MQVYKTQHKGWAVRSWDNIPSGAPIVPYYGTIHTREEYHPDTDTYILDLDAEDVLERGRRVRLEPICFMEGVCVDRIYT